MLLIIPLETMQIISIFVVQKKDLMKKDIHPEYRDVVFKDISTDWAFKSKSTIKTKDTITWEDGNEYPLVKLEVSSNSHPFFTGKQKLLDTAGRVDKFYSKYGNKLKNKKEEPAKAKEEPAKEESAEKKEEKDS